MKTILLLNFMAVSAFAQSPVLESTVPGLTIKNSHAVDSSSHTYRGSQPLSKVGELKKFAITDVLIIKNQTRDEVDSEVSALGELGIRATVIPLNWKDPDLRKTCSDVVQAVRTLQAHKNEGRRTFFHCTAGEDRTGMVAALFRMIDQKWTADQAFQNEMCKHGYSDGDPKKPAEVVALIERNLTPVFAVLSRQAAEGYLDARSCATLTAVAPERPIVMTCGSK